MKKYPVYKPEPRLPGVTEVPEHWEVIRNSVVFREVSETGYGDLELLSILSDRGVIKQSETGRKARAPEDRSQYKRILKGDIGDNLMNAFVGAIGVSNYDGIISPAYAVCRPKIEIDATYFHYLFRTDLYLTEFDRNAYGIMDERNRLYFDKFKKIYVPFPPIDEQRRIVTYINHKLAQIDKFICYKRRLIELLNEQKTALINRAVTKGLAPNVPMKPSGIEWLGEIPAHWKVKRFKFVSKRIGDGDHQPPHRVSEGIPYITAKNLRNGRVSYEGCFYVPFQYRSNSQAAIARDGDCLISCVGSLGEVALFEFTTPECVLDKNIIFVSPENKYLNCKYLFFLLLSEFFQEQVNLWTKGSAQGHIYLGQIRNGRVILPPLEEQDNIVSYLEEEISNFQLATAQAEKEIELIQEYRTTLISDAVTGKIDVRDTLERGAALVAGGV